MVAQFYRYILKALCNGFNFQLHWTEECLEYQQKHSYEVGGGGTSEMIDHEDSELMSGLIPHGFTWWWY